MDQDIGSEPRHSAELRYLQEKLLLPARSPSVAAAQQTNGSSASGLYMLLGAWAASWAILVSLSSWLK
jgi:hypothetical protein